VPSKLLGGLTNIIISVASPCRKLDNESSLLARREVKCQNKYVCRLRLPEQFSIRGPFPGCMTVHLVDTHPCPHPRPHPQRDPHPGALAIGWLVCTGTWQTLEPHKRSEGSDGMRAKSFASNIIIGTGCKANQKENWQQFVVLRKNITNSLGEIIN